MNRLKAEVFKIDEFEMLHIIRFKSLDDICITMMTLELPKIEIGSKVILSFKPTHGVLLKKREDAISLDNQIKAVIHELSVGKLLVSVKVKREDNEMETVITKEAFERMDLKKGDRVYLGINASEIFIKEVLG